MQTLHRAGLSILAVLSTLACSASSGPAGEAIGENGGSSSSGTGGTTSTSGTGGAIPTSGTGGAIPTSGTGGSAGSSDVCAPQSATGRLVKEPVDIIVVLDNSGSMVEEMAAAETNIQNNFWTILDENSVDFRMIMISRHRQGARTGSESEADTSICISAPLSGLATCPSEEPVFSERYYQFGMKVESTDSFDRILEWYNSPDEENDGLAENGWSEWLRPEAKKVFVEMTDDNEDMPAATFIDQLTALPGGHFGTPTDLNFTFHTIMGIQEKPNPTDAWLPDEPIITEMCTGNGADVENAGETYQELSKLTGGLRFPLCQFPGYDAVFTQIANDVVVTSEIACSFPMPNPPAGTTLDPNKIAVNYTPGDGSDAVKYGQAIDESQCQEDAFFISEDGLSIELCAETCAALQADPFAKVDVLFTCESQIIPPR
jgi:hypothetical protein